MSKVTPNSGRSGVLDLFSVSGLFFRQISLTYREVDEAMTCARPPSSALVVAFVVVLPRGLELRVINDHGEAAILLPSAHMSRSFSDERSSWLVSKYALVVWPQLSPNILWRRVRRVRFWILDFDCTPLFDTGLLGTGPSHAHALFRVRNDPKCVFSSYRFLLWEEIGL